MKRTLFTLATASILVTGCGRAALDQAAEAPAPFHGGAAPFTAAPAVEAAPPPPAVSLFAPAEAAKVEPIDSAALAAAAQAIGARAPGDFVVYRFTGSFRKAPLTLTEKVVARSGALLTLDLAAQEGSEKQELRVTIDEASPSHNEVVSVAELEGGLPKPATLARYEALMARTALAADQNEALLGTEDVSVDVGGASVPARKTTYQVRVGKKHALMRTFESSAFAWGDVGGDITANGKVLYRAEVVESGHDDATAKAAAMATP
jgi:hypothetical protein